MRLILCADKELLVSLEKYSLGEIPATDSIHKPMQCLQSFLYNQYLVSGWPFEGFGLMKAGFCEQNH